MESASSFFARWNQIKRFLPSSAMFYFLRMETSNISIPIVDSIVLQFLSVSLNCSQFFLHLLYIPRKTYHNILFTMISLLSKRLVCLLLLSIAILATTTQAWVSSSSRAAGIGRRQFSTVSLSSTTVNSNPPSVNDAAAEDDDDEYEYVEYDILSEPEFVGSEWLVGTCMDKKPNKIAETWVRLIVDKKGKNVAIWGDNCQGTWNFDKANQFLSMSKENIFGKDIWAGVVEDYYFTQGTVRGWNFFTAAAVVAQWQGKRLGADPEESGIAPWFEEQEEEDTPSLPEGDQEVSS
jgi:hypothetical protein